MEISEDLAEVGWSAEVDSEGVFQETLGSGIREEHLDSLRICIILH